MQLDAEDEEHAYYRPPVIQTTAGTSEQGESRMSGETQVEAASSIATTEDD